MEKSGQTLIGAELAVEYGITDDGGRVASVLPRPARNSSDQAVRPHSEVTMIAWTAHAADRVVLK